MLKQRLKKLSEEQLKIMDELSELGKKYDHYDLMVALELKADIYQTILEYKDQGFSPDDFSEDLTAGLI